MNPAKLFDYLDGKLNDWERRELEGQIEKDPFLQKELAAARRIHSGMRAEKMEVLPQDDGAAAARGRKMSLRIGVAFLILMAVNVGAGLFFIARHEAGNPNQKSLAEQSRQQLAKSLQEASRKELPPPTLDFDDLTISVAAAEMKNVAEQVAELARKAGADATVALPDEKQINVAVEIPANKEAMLRNELGALPGARIAPAPPNDDQTPGLEKKRLIIHVLRTGAAQ
jgi:anti-sigma factor RsiW